MFELNWTPTVADDYTFTMMVLNSADSIIFERSCTVTAYEPSTPFNEEPITLPGILEAEDFDNGANGVAYSDTDNKNDGDDLSEKSFLKELDNTKNSIRKYFSQVESLAINRNLQKRQKMG